MLMMSERVMRLGMYRDAEAAGVQACQGDGECQADAAGA